MRHGPLDDPAWHEAERRHKAEHDWATRLVDAWLKGYRHGLGGAREEPQRVALPEVARRLRERRLDAERIVRLPHPRPEDRRHLRGEEIPVTTGRALGAHLELPKELEEEEGIATALEAMRSALASEEVRELLEIRRKTEREQAPHLEAAEKQGREDARRDLFTAATRLLEEGGDLETVTGATGLEPEELRPPGGADGLRPG